jgi:uncharacterized DUF497 family protein
VILEWTQSPLAVPIICYYNKSTMKITFDAAKREKNRDEKGLDLARAARGPARRIISMRKANEREIKKYTAALG